MSYSTFGVFRNLFFCALIGLSSHSVLAQPPQRPEPAPVQHIQMDLSDLVVVKAGQPEQMFDSLAPLPAGHSLDDYAYIAEEYWIEGVASGQMYKTRFVLRRPADDKQFSGLIMAEAMHPSGNAWIYHFNHRYLMDSGHIGVDIFTSNPNMLLEANATRYAHILLNGSQTSDIIAQVGAFLKSDLPDNPLRGLNLRKMILSGTSSSAETLMAYLPTHMQLRLDELAPIYDGFLPTSNATEIQQVDVPTVHVTTISEIERARLAARQDSDEPGQQYRLYEQPGIAHLDTRDVAGFHGDTCTKPISMHPIGTGFSSAMHLLFNWVDIGLAPPKAPRILVDRNVENDGSMMALDQYGNPQGGVPSPYINVPLAKYGVHNEPNPSSSNPASRICFLAGYQYEFTDTQLKNMYGTAAEYRHQVALEVDKLISEGWLLPVDAAIVLADAEQVEF